MQVDTDAHLRAWRFDGAPLDVPRVTVVRVGRDCTTFVSQRETKDRDIQYAGHILIEDGGLSFERASRQQLPLCRTIWKDVSAQYVLRACDVGDTMGIEGQDVIEVLALDAGEGTTPLTLRSVECRAWVFDGKGDHLLTVERMGAQLWDLATGEPHVLANGPAVATDLDAGGDSGVLAIDGELRVFRRPFAIKRPSTWGDLVRTVRAATPTCLTPPQRRAFLGEEAAAARAAYDECAHTNGVVALSDDELAAAGKRSSQAKANDRGRENPSLKGAGPPAGVANDARSRSLRLHSLGE